MTTIAVFERERFRSQCPGCAAELAWDVLPEIFECECGELVELEMSDETRDLILQRSLVNDLRSKNARLRAQVEQLKQELWAARRTEA